MAAGKDLSSGTDSLRNIPDDISVCYLPEYLNISKRSQEKGLRFFTQGYIHDIKVNDTDIAAIKVYARCWRSMRKSELPHKIDITISVTDKKLTNAYCTCKAG